METSKSPLGVRRWCKKHTAQYDAEVKASEGGDVIDFEVEKLMLLLEKSLWPDEAE